LATSAVQEYRFARESVGSSAGLRDRLKAAGLQDWRFDIAWPSMGLAVELEGGTWTGGRHTRGAGFAEDCRKYNAAQLLGWLVLRFTADQLKDQNGFLGAVRQGLAFKGVAT
jgi:very-short-patch-repair endonuclease